METPVENDRPVLRVGVISLGGARRAAMEEQFAALQAKQKDLQIEVTYIDGVLGMELKKKQMLKEAAACLLEGEGGLNFNKMHDVVRTLPKHGLAELGCLLAHLRAMDLCTARGVDVILEDNTRLWEASVAPGAQLWACAEALRSGRADMVYYGYLGSVDHLDTVQRDTLSPALSRGDVLVDLPVGRDETTGKSFDLLWGAYAYGVRRKAYETFLAALRADMGAFLFGRRGKPAEVKPVDKTLPRRLLMNQCSVRISTRPCVFRAPMLTSTIHTKWDAKFAMSTTHQLALNGLDWADVWLTEAERNVAAECAWAAGATSAPPPPAPANTSDNVTETH